MFSYKFIVCGDKNNSLRLRLISNRKKVEISLGIQITQGALDNALSSKPRPENMKWRSVLTLYQRKLDEIKCELIEEERPDEDVNIIRQMVMERVLNKSQPEPVPQTPPTGDFVEWFMRFTNTHPQGTTRTRRCYLHTLSRIRDYDHEIDSKSFSDITVAYLDTLDVFWAKTMSLNSRNHHFRNIRAVFKYAIRNDLDIRNPFDRMRLRKEETQKRSLDIDDLRYLFYCEVDPYAQIYRDMFLLSFMLIGINPVDLFRLDRTASGRIDYRRAKTHKLYSIRVEPEAIALITKYEGEKMLLCLADRWKSHEAFGKACNAALQAIGAPKPAPGRKRKGYGRFDGLTLYWARHTWATIAAELDIPDAVIGMALGHSSANAVTDIYIKRNLKKVDEANRRVLDWVLYGKR